MPVGVALAILVTKGFLVGRVTLEIAPPAAEPSPEVRSVKAGELVAEAGIAPPAPAVLAEAARVDVAGDGRTVDAGTRLFRVAVGGGAGEALVRKSPTYCEPLRVNAKMAGKAVLDSAAFGIFGNALRTHSTSLLCFVDADADGRFENAFHSGAQRSADRVLTPVGPFAYTREPGVAPVQASKVGVVFVGQKSGNLVFELRLVDAAGKRIGGRIGAGIPLKKLPGKLVVDPAELEVLGYDAAAKTARVRVLRGLEPGTAAFVGWTLADIVPKKDERKPPKDGE
ncbi:MAG TPA: hypothetical protein VHM92_09430 [Allosphingosinicella sp.]|nr:hypothetical protein [Allosphingosinicella sp.]